MRARGTLSSRARFPTGLGGRGIESRKKLRPPVLLHTLMSLFFWLCRTTGAGGDEIVRLSAVQACFRAELFPPLCWSELGSTHLHGLVPV